MSSKAQFIENKRSAMRIVEGATVNKGWGTLKYDILYDMAVKARETIVEIGSGIGIGTLTLALASENGYRVPVYTIDPFTYNRGWAGEVYDESTKTQWFHTMRWRASTKYVYAVMLPIEILLDCWPHPAAFTLWDLPFPLIEERGLWLRRWCSEHVLPGGIVAIDETGTDNLKVDSWLAINKDIVRLRSIRHHMRVVERK